MKTSDQITPALKSWLDNVIVPALLKAFLSEIKQRNEFASPSKNRLESPLVDLKSEKNL